MWMRKPKYERAEALVTASAAAYEILGGKYNPDVVFWEAALENRIEDPGKFMVAIVNELGLDNYLKIRNEIAKKGKDLTKAA